MIADFRALGYLEWRQLVNLIRRTLKQPGRLILYVLAGAYFGGILFMRTKTRVFGGFHGIAEPFSSAIGFGAIALIFASCLAPAMGRVAAFSSIADARFLIDSKLDERNVLVWLQLRTSWRVMGRFLLLALVYAVVFPSAGTARGMVFSIVGVTALATAFNLPIMRLRREGFSAIATICIVAMIVCAGAGAALVLAPLIAPGFASVAVSLQHWGLGRAVAAMLGGDQRMLAVIWLLALAAMTLSYLGSTDLYPELYAASLQSIQHQARRKRNPFAAYSHRAALAEPRGMLENSSGVPRVGGAWTVLWKEWVAFRRRRGAKAMLALSLLAAAIAGSGIGMFAQRTHDEPLALSISLGASLGNVVLIFMALGTSVALSEDLRKPLWWLSAATLRSRLYVWVLAMSWRIMLIAAIASLAWSLAMASVAFGVVATLLAAVLAVFVRTIGLGLYALFPSKLDQRGPVAMLRLFLMYLLLIPAFAGGIAAGVLMRSTVVGLVVAAAVAILEGAFLVEFAALRIAGIGAGVAQAEET